MSMKPVERQRMKTDADARAEELEHHQHHPFSAADTLKCCACRRNDVNSVWSCKY